MADSRPKPAFDDPGLPPALAERLRVMYGHAPEVPPERDAAILNEAKSGFWRRRRSWVVLRWSGVAAAAAAAVVVLVVNLNHGTRPTPVAISQRPALAGDVDRDGRVDMLDALALARKVDAGGTPAAKPDDVNGDGLVDGRDVDEVAGIAVRLGDGLAAQPAGGRAR